MEGRVKSEEARRCTLLAALCGLLLAGLGSGCGTSSTGDDLAPSVEMVDSGSWYVRQPWPHDGNPIESENFVVYSDAASLEARRAVADRGERLLAEIVTEMGIDTEEMLRLPPGHDKIDIYAFENRSPEWAGKAYYGGLLIFSLDHEGRSASGQTEPETYESILKHEMIHVITVSLLHGGGLTEPPWVHVWFFEGWAEALSAGTGAGAIRGMDHFNYLTSKYGHLNPVSYRSDEKVEGGVDAYTEYHYPMRQLAVEYLLDEEGLGRTPSDGTALFVDMAAGSDFETAFEDHMGISLADYEEAFFERISGYLPERSRSIAFGPLGLLVISLFTVGVASAVSIRSIRSSPAVAMGESTIKDSYSSRLGQIGFGVWITAVSALSLGLFLIGVYSIGGSWALAEADKTVGLTVMIAYLAVCAVVLTWAIRLRRHRHGIAWLIPLVAIGAAAATTVLFSAVL